MYYKPRGFLYLGAEHNLRSLCSIDTINVDSKPHLAWFSFLTRDSLFSSLFFSLSAHNQKIPDGDQFITSLDWQVELQKFLLLLKRAACCEPWSALHRGLGTNAVFMEVQDLVSCSCVGKHWGPQVCSSVLPLYASLRPRASTLTALNTITVPALSNTAATHDVAM